ncbi:MAG: beta-N-acetylhexosaminidase [Anaerolineales bacterium]
MNSLIPQPRTISKLGGTFTVNSGAAVATPNHPEIINIAKLFVEQIHRLTGVQFKTSQAEGGAIRFVLANDSQFGDEGYELAVSSDGIVLRASQPAGLFYASQTLTQLLGAAQNSTFSLPALSISDSPRFIWRGAMLDVARHFFSVEDVKRFIDLISHYKMNRLHLHLTDDQGWRIEIKSWGNLTAHGAKTQVNGGGGGFYTQEQYKEIVEYARARYVVIVPEIDTPGHTNAALSSYPELNASGETPGLYEGIEVGFSSLGINMDITYRFLDDVIRELAAITPGAYIHIGGDEAHSTPKEDYVKFIEKIQRIVTSHNKSPIGWAEIGEVTLDPKTIAQHWQGAAYQEAKKQGNKIILSPGNKAYLDMKYDEASPLGLNWAGYISVKDSYDWDPVSYMEGLEERDILGIEAPLWSETLLTIKDIEYMAFPRLPGLAELAWSPKAEGWEEYKIRLAQHGRHMEKLGINFFKSPDVDWK